MSAALDPSGWPERLPVGGAAAPKSQATGRGGAAEPPLLALEQALRRATAGAGPAQPVVDHVLARPGKRLRARLLLAVAAFDDAAPAAAALAAAVAVELLHEASLLHDDVCDGSPTRRGAPSAAAAFGIRAAALAGTFLAGRGITLLATLCVDHHLDLRWEQLAAVAGGQLAEALVASGRSDAGEAAALAIARAKTGALFRLACDVGGRLAGLAPAPLAALQAFGEHLGVAFQLRDDLDDAAQDAGGWRPPPGRLAALAAAERSRAALALRQLPDRPARRLLAELTWRIA